MVAFLAEKTPQFVIGFCLGLLIALVIAYVYLLPRFVRNATAAISTQVELLTGQVLTQTNHIAHLETQITRLESELVPYRHFAEQQLARYLVPDATLTQP